MSVRVYTGPHAARRRGPTGAWSRVPVVLAVITVLAQIAWPLAHDQTRATLTVVTVVLFFLTSASHAWVSRGVGWMLGWFVLSAGFGLALEVLGTRTGLPFGHYAYDGTALGPALLGVPAIIPLAWAMMSYPALLVGRQLARRWVWVALVGGWAFAAWDLFLDPQMVGERYWTWRDPSPFLHGVPGIPVQNYLAWLVAAVVLMLLLDRLPRRYGAPQGVPAAMYLWTWVGGVVANAFFLDRPWVALWGGVAMALVAVPYAVSLLGDAG
jgi:putative membrane protein